MVPTPLPLHNHPRSFTGAQESIPSLAGRYDSPICRTDLREPVFLNVYGAPELIPRNEFRETM
jgi:hypothetical protein